jgi:7-carboxy-7-deazaguanine synthase
MSEKLPIIEMYSCIQGEGKYMGIPHLLFRFTGCPLRCQFRDSFCDTPYASWSPEKSLMTWDDVHTMFKQYSNIKHTMITGGSPTMHPEVLQELCVIGKTYGHHITIETEGTKFVQTVADFISLSPKLSNSVPIPGTYNDVLGREVTEADKAQHVKNQYRFSDMEQLITNHPDYQLKPVFSDSDSMVGIKNIQRILNIPNDKVYLMPEGITDEQLQTSREEIVTLCTDYGYNFTDRLQIIIYGNKRGV